MTIAVDLGRKATNKQTNKTGRIFLSHTHPHDGYLYYYRVKSTRHRQGNAVAIRSFSPLRARFIKSIKHEHSCNILNFFYQILLTLFHSAIRITHAFSRVPGIGQYADYSVLIFSIFQVQTHVRPDLNMNFCSFDDG